MKMLVLMRHCDAVNDSPSGTDRDRPLSERGRQHAIAQGAWLSGRGFTLGRVLCSPAARAVQTAEHAGVTITHTLPAIYTASPGDLIRLVESHQYADTVLLIGHNPGIAGAAGYLSGKRIAMQPGTVVGLSFSRADQSLQPGSAELRLFRHPTDPAGPH